MRGTSKDIGGTRKSIESEKSANVVVSASASAAPLPCLRCRVGDVHAVTVLSGNSCIAIALKSSWDAAAAVSLGSVSIEDGEALALRLREDLANINGVNKGGIHDSRSCHILSFVSCGIEDLRSDVHNSADSAVDSA